MVHDVYSTRCQLCHSSTLPVERGPLIGMCDGCHEGFEVEEMFKQCHLASEPNAFPPPLHRIGATLRPQHLPISFPSLRTWESPSSHEYSTKPSKMLNAQGKASGEEMCAGPSTSAKLNTAYHPEHSTDDPLHTFSMVRIRCKTSRPWPFYRIKRIRLMRSERDWHIYCPISCVIGTILFHRQQGNTTQT